jgi:hypothetical protein
MFALFTIDGSVTFQLQFTWEPCTNEQADANTSSHKVACPRLRTPSIITRKRGMARSNFTPEEDSLIITLKDQGMSWRDIHTQHKNKFPERAVGCLQVRYSTKLKSR